MHFTYGLGCCFIRPNKSSGAFPRFGIIPNRIQDFRNLKILTELTWSSFSSVFFLACQDLFYAQINYFNTA
jgi:hypothetical protein